MVFKHFLSNKIIHDRKCWVHEIRCSILTSTASSLAVFNPLRYCQFSLWTIDCLLFCLSMVALPVTH